MPAERRGFGGKSDAKSYSAYTESRSSTHSTCGTVNYPPISTSDKWEAALKTSEGLFRPTVVFYLQHIAIRVKDAFQR